MINTHQINNSSEDGWMGVIKESREHLLVKILCSSPHCPWAGCQRVWGEQPSQKTPLLLSPKRSPASAESVKGLTPQQRWRCCWLQCPCLWLLMSLSHFPCITDVSQGGPVFGKRRNDETIWYHLLVWKVTQSNDATCARPQASKEQMLNET